MSKKLGPVDSIIKMACDKVRNEFDWKSDGV